MGIIKECYMSKSKRKLYDSDKINNFRELVDRYETLYADKVAFKYKKDPKLAEQILITYHEFVKDIKALRNCFIAIEFTK